MRGVDRILADSLSANERSENTRKLQPLKITASPNDVVVYYSDYAVVYHAEGSGNERHNVSEAVFNIATVSGAQKNYFEDLQEPGTVSEVINPPTEDPYYIYREG